MTSFHFSNCSCFDHGSSFSLGYSVPLADYQQCGIFFLKSTLWQCRMSEVSLTYVLSVSYNQTVVQESIAFSYTPVLVIQIWISKGLISQASSKHKEIYLAHVCKWTRNLDTANCSNIKLKACISSTLSHCNIDIIDSSCFSRNFLQQCERGTRLHHYSLSLNCNSWCKTVLWT